jgi:hypothetical protein
MIPAALSQKIFGAAMKVPPSLKPGRSKNLTISAGGASFAELPSVKSAVQIFSAFPKPLHSQFRNPHSTFP